MQKFFYAVAFAFLVGFGLANTVVVRAADEAPSTQPAVDPKPVNSKCPVTGDDVDPKVTTVYNGKTYAFCCSDCIKKFNADPAKYSAAAK